MDLGVVGDVIYNGRMPQVIQKTSVDMDPDEDLPWPDPGLIHTWWQENKKRFAAGNTLSCGDSYFGGKLQTSSDKWFSTPAGSSGS